MNLPLLISSRSSASSAVINGLRVNAKAIAVPTPIVDVPAAIAAAAIVALRCSSGTQTTSAPAFSARCAASTNSARVSPHGA